MTLIYQRRHIAAKIEETPGSPETLSASDAAMNVFEREGQQPDVQFIPREGQAGGGKLPGTLGLYIGRERFFTELEFGSPRPAWADIFFPACGWILDSTTYKPTLLPPGASGGQKTITLGDYEDGRRKLLRGCCGTFVMRHITGERIRFEWEFTGALVLGSGKWMQDSGLLSNITFPSVRPLRFVDHGLAFGSANPTLSELTIDAGNEVVPIEGDAPDEDQRASGIKHFHIPNRNPTAQMNPDADLVDNDDIYGDWLAGTTRALSYALAQSTNDFEFDAPAAQIRTIRSQNRNGRVIDLVELDLCRDGSAPNTEFTLDFSSSS